ncbi:MAG: hypothetical protein EOO45_10395 [Flavobacterium sp.]|nr:MAG: hypothetical protein EOO45_10395 [Flavobacterium sp.]
MLLGNKPNNDAVPASESLVIQLMLQQRYAQAYELLLAQQSHQTSAVYNMALCLHWSGNFQEALTRLESIQTVQQMSSVNKVNAKSDLKEIINKQNLTDDYLHAMSDAYVKSFPSAASDAIVRLKTDCWLQLGNYAQVIAVAAPIAHKGYRNITEALQIANTKKDNGI